MTPAYVRFLEGALTNSRQHGPRTSLLKTCIVAGLLNVTSETVRDYVKSGLLPAKRTPGGHYRFDPADVAALCTPTGDLPRDLATPPAQNEAVTQ